MNCFSDMAAVHNMHTLYSISLDRFSPVLGGRQVYWRACGGSSGHLVINAISASPQSEIGVSFASTSNVRAKSFCPPTRKHRRKAVYYGIPPSRSFRKSPSINRAITAKTSGADSGSDKRRLAAAEDSPLAKEEVMLLFYQLEIEQRLQVFN